MTVCTDWQIGGDSHFTANFNYDFLRDAIAHLGLDCNISTNYVCLHSDVCPFPCFSSFSILFPHVFSPLKLSAVYYSK